MQKITLDFYNLSDEQRRKLYWFLALHQYQVSPKSRIKLNTFQCDLQCVYNVHGECAKLPDGIPTCSKQKASDRRINREGKSQSKRSVIGGMIMAECDRIVKALDGFFASQDIDGVPRFRSFREAYVFITGDSTLSGQSQEAHTLAKFPEILCQAITRRMLVEYNATPGVDDWRKIVSDVTDIQDFRTSWRNAHDVTTIYRTLPAVKEGTEALTLEMIAKDDIEAIRRIPKTLGRVAARALYKSVFDVIMDNSITLYDTVPLFDVRHSNLGSDVLNARSLKIAINKMGLPAKWLIVPLELEDTACMLSAAYSLGVIVLPYWRAPNDWALVCDPADCPTIEVGFFNGNEEPELFVQDQPTAGSMFTYTQDKITYEIRHIYGICVLDHRGMYKSVVKGA